ncbi:hypothetical protein [Dokdonella sp.]|uniref:hypothetical protein n=1 Tax=Dokdonella sp. TaxID=2291710 RepID=UPI002F3EFA77
MSFSRLSHMGALVLLASLSTNPARAADGLPDPTFGTGGAAYITPDDVEARELRPYAALALPDGKILVAGERNKFIPSSPFDPHMRGMLARFDADGTPDASFGNIPGIPGVLVLPDLVPLTGAGMQVIEAMVRLDDGSIVVAGTAQAFGPLRGFLVKLDAEGAMDTTFGTDGIQLVPEVYVHALAVDSQGRFVIAGEKSIDTVAHSYVARFDPNGAPDMTFGTDGGVVIDWDGAGESRGGYLATLGLTDGDGILVGGGYEVYGAGMGSDYAIARLDSTGAFDTAFAGTGWRVFHRPDDSGQIIDAIDRLLPTAGGGAVFVGHYQLDDGQGNTSIETVLGGIGADGSMDANFGSGGDGFQPVAIAPGSFTRYATGFVRQADGNLVASISYVGPESSFLAFRFTPDGTLDTSFGDAGIASVDMAPGGVFSDPSALTLDAQGRAIVAGMAERTAPLYELAVLRLTHDDPQADRIFANGFDGTR